jgi:hypothetical protein
MTNGVISSGNWNNAAMAGVWIANLNNYRSNSNDNVGLRADCGFPSYSARKQWSHRDALSRVTRNVLIPLFLVGKPKIREAYS